MRTSARMSNCGTRGIITRSTRGYSEDTGREVCRPFSRREEEEVDRMEAEDRSAKKLNSRRKVMENSEDKNDEYLAAIYTTTEVAAGKVAHQTKAEREKIYNAHLTM